MLPADSDDSSPEDKKEREKKMVINSTQLMRHQPGDQIVIHTHK